MHPLRVLLYLSLGVAAGIAGAFAYLLERIGIGRSESLVLAVLVFLAFLVPAGAVFAWAVRRAADLDTLTDRTAAAVTSPAVAIHDRPYHGELDELARGIEELRAAVLRERSWSAEQRATMQQIAASLGEGLLAINARGRIVLANERLREMFSVGDDPVGRPLLEVIRAHSLVSAFERALGGEASRDRLVVGERQIELRVAPVARSTDVSAVALFIDLTQLERLQKIRREFLDDFSHEVRTPLAGLRSAVETFERGGLAPADEEQLRAVMTRQLSRIERLVKDLSELNRIESGELVLERRQVDLKELVADLCSDFASRLSGKPVRFTVQGEPTIACVDSVRTQQIVSNLLDNAWKHGGGKGEIVVGVSREDGQAVVSVSDEGEGIPAREIDRIFNRFYRVDKSRSQSVPGVGLGLAIAKHLALLHGGSIRAFNRPGGGATFEVRLPVA